METEALGAAQAVSELDFTLSALFLRATVVVQIVMVVLVIASFWSWAIVVDRAIAYARARREIRMFEDAFWSGQPLDALYDRVGQKPRSCMERVFSAGMGEWRRSFDRDGKVTAGSRERIDRTLDVAIAREGAGFQRRLGFLATVGSISPFVGLFGTVWGIKHSFEAIAISQNTNLAVVAPGIAEALVATAIGLLAAIPAVIFYNKLLSDSGGLTGQLENFADEFSVILSRQVERREA